MKIVAGCDLCQFATVVRSLESDSVHSELWADGLMGEWGDAGKIEGQ